MTCDLSCFVMSCLEVYVLSHALPCEIGRDYKPDVKLRLFCKIVLMVIQSEFSLIIILIFLTFNNNFT